jgi:hypothetical protein
LAAAATTSSCSPVSDDVVIVSMPLLLPQPASMAAATISSTAMPGALS